MGFEISVDLHTISVAIDPVATLSIPNERQFCSEFPRFFWFAGRGDGGISVQEATTLPESL